MGIVDVDFETLCRVDDFPHEIVFQPWASIDRTRGEVKSLRRLVRAAFIGLEVLGKVIMMKSGDKRWSGGVGSIVVAVVPDRSDRPGIFVRLLMR